ncbi:MAG: Rrf2 family transcriptional regulator [Proteobacteria bacterium]|nr:Rrf2 family transcriptional regulator [Pseudomonadota bacterium]
MKLSTRARYALRMMVAIARQTDGDTAKSLSDVAGETRISRRYLEQLAIALKNASLIRGKTGKGGGYVLTQPAVDITLSQIVEAAIGPINIVECVLRPQTCIEADLCECRWVYQTINNRIVSVLNELFLDDLVARPASESVCQGLAINGSSCPTRQSSSVSSFKEDNQ